MHRLFKELDSPYIGDIRGYGLVTGVELVTDRESKTIAKSLTAATIYRAFELGLCVFSVGPNVLEITPPMIISDEMIERGVSIIGQAIEDAASGKVDPEAVAAFSGW
jgi:4-aminobutyrate aminotransferase